ncbi:muconolactone Delta-isomerase [Corynebacterium sp. A21]|uniref:muconolactone Delta-isomerase n=1 Tax=Corynebacterium sp. A21 TaxID=3457318 RepID=UPI003FD5036C
MAIFHCRFTEALPSDMDPEIRADHLERHRRALRSLQDEGILRHCWRAAGTRTDILVLEVADPGELHERLHALPLFRVAEVEISALVPHPDLS